MLIFGCILVNIAFFSWVFSLITPNPWFWFLWIPLGLICALLNLLLLIVILLAIYKHQGDKAYNNPFVKFFSVHLACFVNLFLGIIVKTEGRENLTKETNVLYVGNHKSDVDPIILFQALKRPCCFASKSTLWNVSLFRVLGDDLGMLKIDRENDRNTVKEIIRGIKYLKNGTPLCIFPEGGIKTREVEQMVSLKAGAYKLATKSNAIIQPFCIYNSSKVDQRKFFIPFIKVRVKILPAIYPDEYKDLNTHDIGYEVIKRVNKEFDEEPYEITEEE